MGHLGALGSVGSRWRPWWLVSTAEPALADSAILQPPCHHTPAVGARVSPSTKRSSASVKAGIAPGPTLENLPATANGLAVFRRTAGVSGIPPAHGAVRGLWVQMCRCRRVTGSLRSASVRGELFGVGRRTRPGRARPLDRPGDSRTVGAVREPPTVFFEGHAAQSSRALIQPNEPVTGRPGVESNLQVGRDVEHRIGVGADPRIRRCVLQSCIDSRDAAEARQYRG